jgi:uncharacterized membrane protein
VKRYVALLWALIFLLGLLVRISHLGAMSVWSDEAFGYQFASRPIGNMLPLLKNDVHPPLYFLLLHMWLYFGSSAVWLRSLSVVFGMLVLIIGYLIGKRFFGTYVGLLLMFFMAISPMEVHYSQEMRMYSLLAFLTGIMIYAALLYIQTLARRHMALFVASAALCLYTHYYSLFLIGGLLLYSMIELLGRGLKPETALRKVLTCLLLIVLLYLPWEEAFFTHLLNNILMGVHSFERGGLTLGRLHEYLYDPLLGVVPWVPIRITLSSHPFSTLFWYVELLVFLLVVIIVGLRGLQLLWADVSWRRFIICALAIPLLLTLLHVQMHGRLYSRCFIVYLPVVFLILSVSLVHMRSRTVAAGLLIFLTFFFYLSSKTYLSMDIRDVTLPAYNYVAESSHADDLIVHANPFSFMPFLYYDRAHADREYILASQRVSLIVRLLAGKRKILVRPEQLTRSHRLWLVVSDWSFDNRDWLGRLESSWLSSGWIKERERRFSGGLKWCDIAFYRRVSR